MFVPDSGAGVEEGADYGGDATCGGVVVHSVSARWHSCGGGVGEVFEDRRV